VTSETTRTDLTALERRGLLVQRKVGRRFAWLPAPKPPRLLPVAGRPELGAACLGRITAPTHFEVSMAVRILPDLPIVEARSALPRFGRSRPTDRTDLSELR
jgi:hypothetical protein